MSLSERVVNIRKSLNLTQKEFAEKIGYTHAATARWESGSDVPDSSLLLIEYVYNVNPQWLRTGQGNMFKNTSKETPQPTETFSNDDFEATLQILKILETALKSAGIKADTDKKIELIRYLFNSYKKTRDSGKIINITDYLSEELPPVLRLIG